MIVKQTIGSYQEKISLISTVAVFLLIKKLRVFAILLFAVFIFAIVYSRSFFRYYNFRAFFFAENTFRYYHFRSIDTISYIIFLTDSKSKNTYDSIHRH